MTYLLLTVYASTVAPSSVWLAVLPLTAVFVAELIAVAVPVLADRHGEHRGATEDWSPLAQLDTIPVAQVLAPAATGWPA